MPAQPGSKKMTDKAKTSFTDEQQAAGATALLTMYKSARKEADAWRLIVTTCAKLTTEKDVRDWTAAAIETAAAIVPDEGTPVEEHRERIKEACQRFRSYGSLLALCRKEGIGFGPYDSAHSLRKSRAEARKKAAEADDDSKKEAKALKKVSEGLDAIDGLWYGPAISAVLAAAERLQGSEQLGRELAEHIADWTAAKAADDEAEDKAPKVASPKAPKKKAAKKKAAAAA